VIAPRHRPAALWLVAVGGSLALGMIVGVAQAWLSPAWGGAATTLACLAGLGLCAWKWTAIDEAAREAHKFAWFWGGSASLCVIGGLYVWLVRGGDASSLARMSHSPGELIALGIGVCILIQLVGYLAAWAGWWLARR
jgi:hypothetical protein